MLAARSVTSPMFLRGLFGWGSMRLVLMSLISLLW